MLNRVFTTSLVSLLASYANAAKAIESSCLILSDTTAGQQTGSEFTHEIKLLTDSITDDMRINYVTMCTSEEDDGELEGNLVYIRLILSARRLAVPVTLDPVGIKSDFCEMINVSDGGVTKIIASSNERGSGVNAIKYKVGSAANT